MLQCSAVWCSVVQCGAVNIRHENTVANFTATSKLTELSPGREGMEANQDLSYPTRIAEADGPYASRREGGKGNCS